MIEVTVVQININGEEELSAMLVGRDHIVNVIAGELNMSNILLSDGTTITVKERYADLRSRLLKV